MFRSYLDIHRVGLNNPEVNLMLLDIHKHDLLNYHHCLCVHCVYKTLFQPLVGISMYHEMGWIEPKGTNQTTYSQPPGVDSQNIPND